jgi:hypothetical protein
VAINQDGSKLKSIKLIDVAALQSTINLARAASKSFKQFTYDKTNCGAVQGRYRIDETTKFKRIAL